MGGAGKLRKFLTEALRKAGGHIGYAIVPEQRGKGYGKAHLGLFLEKAHEQRIGRVLLTIHDDNPASIAVAQGNGVYLGDDRG